MIDISFQAGEKFFQLLPLGLLAHDTERACDRETRLDHRPQILGKVDLVFDVIGGDIQQRSAGLIKPGGTLVSIVGPIETRPSNGLAIDFVVEANRLQLCKIVQRVRDGRLRTNIGMVATLDEAVAAFNSTMRLNGKTIIRVRP